jgi:hypothetical protein
MKRTYEQGVAMKREASSTWVLFLHTGEIVGTCQRAGRKLGRRWRVSPNHPPLHRVYADTLGEAIEKAAKYRS